LQQLGIKLRRRLSTTQQSQHIMQTTYDLPSV